MATPTEQEDVLGLMGGLPALTPTEGMSVTPGVVQRRREQVPSGQTKAKGAPVAPARKTTAAPVFAPLPLTPEAAPSVAPPTPPKAAPSRGLSLDFMPAAEAATLRPTKPAGPVEFPSLTKLRQEAQPVWQTYADPDERATLRDIFEESFANVRTQEDFLKASQTWSRQLAAMARDLKAQGATDEQATILLAAPREIANRAFALAPPKMDELGDAEAFLLNAQIGIRNYSMIAQIGNYLTNLATDDPFYVPPNLKQNPWIQNSVGSLAMLGELGGVATLPVVKKVLGPAIVRALGGEEKFAKLFADQGLAGLSNIIKNLGTGKAKALGQLGAATAPALTGIQILNKVLTASGQPVFGKLGQAAENVDLVRIATGKAAAARYAENIRNTALPTAQKEEAIRLRREKIEGQAVKPQVQERAELPGLSDALKMMAAASVGGLGTGRVMGAMDPNVRSKAAAAAVDALAGVIGYSPMAFMDLLNRGEIDLSNIAPMLLTSAILRGMKFQPPQQGPTPGLGGGPGGSTGAGQGPGAGPGGARQTPPGGGGQAGAGQGRPGAGPGGAGQGGRQGAPRRRAESSFTPDEKARAADLKKKIKQFTERADRLEKDAADPQKEESARQGFRNEGNANRAKAAAFQAELDAIFAGEWESADAWKAKMRGQAGAGQAGTGQPGAGQAGTGQAGGRTQTPPGAGTDQAGAGTPPGGQAGADQAGAGTPPGGQAGAGTPPGGQAGAGTPPGGQPPATPAAVTTAKPRYSYGSKGFTLEWESDLDKALYIIQSPRAANRQVMLDWVMATLGIDEAEAVRLGEEVKNAIKQQAKDAPAGGSLRIPEMNRRQEQAPPGPNGAPADEGTAGAGDQGPPPGQEGGEGTPPTGQAPTLNTIEDYVREVEAIRNTNADEAIRLFDEAIAKFGEPEWLRAYAALDEEGTTEGQGQPPPPPPPPPPTGEGEAPRFTAEDAVKAGERPASEIPQAQGTPEEQIAQGAKYGDTPDEFAAAFDEILKGGDPEAIREAAAAAALRGIDFLDAVQQKFAEDDGIADPPPNFAAGEETKSGFRRVLDKAKDIFPAIVAGLGTAATIGILGAGAADAIPIYREMGAASDPSVLLGALAAGIVGGKEAFMALWQTKRGRQTIKSRPELSKEADLFGDLVKLGGDLAKDLSKYGPYTFEQWLRLLKQGTENAFPATIRQFRGLYNEVKDTQGIQPAETPRARTEERVLGYGRKLDALDSNLKPFVPSKAEAERMAAAGELEYGEPVPFSFQNQPMGVAHLSNMSTPTKAQRNQRLVPRMIHFSQEDGTQGRLTIIGPQWPHRDSDEDRSYKWLLQGVGEDGTPGPVISQGLLSFEGYRNTLESVKQVTDLQQRLIGLNEGTYEDATDALLRTFLRRNRKQAWNYEETENFALQYVFSRMGKDISKRAAQKTENRVVKLLDRLWSEATAAADDEVATVADIPDEALKIKPSRREKASYQESVEQVEKQFKGGRKTTGEAKAEAEARGTQGRLFGIGAIAGASLNAGVAQAADTVGNLSQPFLDLGWPELAAGVVAVRLAAPFLVKGLKALSSWAGIDDLQAALMRESELPPREQSIAESVIAEPGAAEAIAEAQKKSGERSYAAWLAGTLTTGAEKALGSLPELNAEIMRMTRTLAEGAVVGSALGAAALLGRYGKKIQDIVKDGKGGIDPDTLRQTAIWSLITFLGRTKDAMIFDSKLKIAAGLKGMTGGRLDWVPSRVPQELVGRMEASLQKEASGIEAAQVAELYLRQQYGLNQRDLLERYIAIGRPLPPQIAADPIIKGYLATMPELLPYMRRMGFIKPYQEEMMTRFLIRTMTPTAPGLRGFAQKIAQTAFGIQPKGVERFGYGAGYEPNLTPDEHRDLTRPWQFVGLDDANNTMEILDPGGYADAQGNRLTPEEVTRAAQDGILDELTYVPPESRTVSTLAGEDGIIEAANYLQKNWAASQATGQEVYESPWVARNGNDVPSRQAGREQVARPWTNAELDANGISRDMATAAFRTLERGIKAEARFDLYDWIAKNGTIDDDGFPQQIAISQSQIRDAATDLPGGKNNWELLTEPRWGPLQNYYLRKDVRRRLSNWEESGAVLAALESAVREFKRSRLFSPAFAFANALGGAGMLLLNGGSMLYLPAALNHILTNSPFYQEQRKRGAFDRSASQDLLMRRFREGEDIRSPIESFMTATGKKIDEGVSALAKELDKRLKGQTITAVNVVAALRDIARTTNPLVLNRFIDDLFRLTLGEGIIREGGTMDGAAVRMREDMYSTVRPQTAAGRVGITLAPWSPWAVWSHTNVPRIMLQNWGSGLAAMTMLGAVAAVNTAAIYGSETAEQRQLRTAKEQAMEYSQTQIPGIPSRGYLSPEMSMRLGAGSPFESILRGADVARTAAELSGLTGQPIPSIGAAIGPGGRNLPISLAGPVGGAVLGLAGLDPTRPDKRWTSYSGEQMGEMAGRILLPKAAEGIRGLSRLLEGEETEGAGAQIPMSQVLKFFGPFETNDPQMALDGLYRVRNRIEMEADKQRSEADARLNGTSREGTYTQAEYDSRVADIDKFEQALLDRLQPRIDALENYQSGYGKPGEPPVR